MLPVCVVGRNIWSISRRCISAKHIIYSEYGDPEKVLSLQTVEVKENIGDNKVRVRWLGAPINPADINQIQGVYPVKPQLPAVGGSEGFGEIEVVGKKVRGLQAGDRVIPSRSGLGTWCTLGNYDQQDVVAIDKDIQFESAATFQVNPPTAYRMLSDFVDLHPGDIVVQNGANSAVGRAVIQIARARGLQTVNVVRKRDDLGALVEDLKSLGADYVFTEEEMQKELKAKPKNARLALNCVGGRSALMLANALGKKGIMVTYGGMSKQPIQIPTGPLIFKDIRLVGYWMSHWYTCPENQSKKRVMYDELSDLIRKGKLRPPDSEKVNLEDWKTAINRAMGGSRKKQILLLQN